MIEPGDYNQSVRKAGVEFTNSIADMDNRYGLEPVPGSQAAIEKQGSSNPGLFGTRVISTAVMLVALGQDHLRLFHSATRVTRHTVARSVFEPCAIVAWLMDSKSDGFERLGRVFALEYKGEEERRKFYASTPFQELEENSKDRIDSLVKKATSLGYTCPRNRKGHLTGGIHTAVPNATSMIRKCLGQREEEWYRFLSGAAHGHPFAVYFLGYKIVRGLKMAVQHENEDGTALSGLNATMAYAKAVWSYGNYMGWDRSNLTGALEKVADALAMEDMDRVWR